MATFRPSSRVRMQLRLDESGDTDSLQAKLERTPPLHSTGKPPAAGQSPGSSSASNLEQRMLLGKTRGLMSPSEVAAERSRLDRERTEQQRQDDTSEAATAPEGFRENPNDERNVIFSVAPQEVQINRNGIKDAAEFSLTFDYRDLPIDPRVARSCFVAIALGSVSEDEFERGMLNQERRNDGSLLSEVLVNPGQEYSFRSSTRFLGWVDTWDLKNSDGGDTLVLTGRDVSAVLRDQRLPDGVSIDLSKPIALGVAELVNQFPASRGMPVVFGTPVDPLNAKNIFVPDYGAVPPAAAIPEVKKSRNGKISKAKRKGDKKQSVWDHIESVLQTMGLIPLMRGFTLYLAEPRVLFSSLNFARKMVWGANIKSLGLARKLGGRIVPTIELRSPDPSIGRTRWARYYPFETDEPTSGILGDPNSPQPIVQRASRLTANGNPQEDIEIYYVANVTDQKVLERLAANTFEEIGRQEIEGSVETDEIQSFDSQEEGDLLDLQPGEPVTILVAVPPRNEDKPVGSSYQELSAQSVENRSTYLQSLGFEPQMAERLARVQESIRFTSTFRAGHVNIKYKAEDGIEMDFDFHNFIVVRDAPRELPKKAPAETISESAEL